jgi:hypothetical protein
MRRETITAGMRSTGLRSVRKTHKVFGSVVTTLQQSLTSPSNTTGNVLASELIDSYFACHSSPLPSPILQTTQHTFSNFFFVCIARRSRYHYSAGCRFLDFEMLSPRPMYHHLSDWLTRRPGSMFLEAPRRRVGSATSLVEYSHETFGQ